MIKVQPITGGFDCVVREGDRFIAEYVETARRVPAVLVQLSDQLFLGQHEQEKEETGPASDASD